MRMPVISARAHIYATECKRRTPRLTVIPHDTRHLLLQHVARAGVTGEAQLRISQSVGTVEATFRRAINVQHVSNISAAGSRPR